MQNFFYVVYNHILANFEFNKNITGSYIWLIMFCLSENNIIITVKILKIGTPEMITIIVLQME